MANKPLKRFKVFNTETGLYWNGRILSNSFTKEGKSWPSMRSLERSLDYYMRQDIFYSTEAEEKKLVDLPTSWVVQEYELVEVESGLSTLDTFAKHQQIRLELEKVYRHFPQFWDNAISKGYADKVEFIMALKPEKDSYWVSFDKTLQARAQLRLLGVKTRTFKEHRGMFGLLDREQALRARLTLDVNHVVDMREVKAKLGI